MKGLLNHDCSYLAVEGGLFHGLLSGSGDGVCRYRRPAETVMVQQINLLLRNEHAGRS